MTTNKQKAFIEEYLKDFNATQAAIRAGYSERSAYSQGQRLLNNDEVSEAIQERLNELHMSADEALKLLSDIARGDLGEFVNDFGMIDISEMRKAGKTRLIKRLKVKTVVGEDEETHIQDVELYPADAAIRDVLKVHGKFKDLGTDDNPLTLKIVKVGIDPDKI